MALRKLGDDALRFRRTCGALGYVPRMSATCAAIAREAYCWAAAGLSQQDAQKRARTLLEDMEKQMIELARSMLQVYGKQGLSELTLELERARHELDSHVDIHFGE
jgi:hypothetical protein